MRILLMVLGAVICAGALFVWIWLNGMAASWNTSNSRHSINWLNKEALLWFWLPCAIGAAIAYLGWRRP